MKNANIDIDIAGERIDNLVVSAEIGEVEYPDSSPISIGYKIFKKPRHFEYQWLVEWMDMDEVVRLRDALDFILQHRVEIDGMETIVRETTRKRIRYDGRGIREPYEEEV